MFSPKVKLPLTCMWSRTCQLKCHPKSIVDGSQLSNLGIRLINGLFEYTSRSQISANGQFTHTHTHTHAHRHTTHTHTRTQVHYSIVQDNLTLLLQLPCQDNIKHEFETSHHLTLCPRNWYWEYCCSKHPCRSTKFWMEELVHHGFRFPFLSYSRPSWYVRHV